ncbi:MAG: HAMP domain-containing sensor histidine kinase [Verrucomicrobiota bacterium]
MKRIAWVFFLAIGIPAILLAALALRSLRDQELVAQSQRASLLQTACENRVVDINLFFGDVRLFYGNLVDELVEREGLALVDHFHERLTAEWSQARVGAAVSDQGEISSPASEDSPITDGFLDRHRDFLSNEATITLFTVPASIQSQPQSIVTVEPPPMVVPEVRESAMSDESPEKSEKPVASIEAEVASATTAAPERLRSANVPEASAAPSQRKVIFPERRLDEARFNGGSVLAEEDRLEAPAATAEEFDLALEAPASSSPGGSIVDLGGTTRNVVPTVQQQITDSDQAGAALAPRSFLNRVAADRSAVTADAEEGALSRFVDGELQVLLWRRHPAVPGHLFWAELDLGQILADIKTGFLGSNSAAADPSSVAFALLNDSAQPELKSLEAFQADWAKPFAAAEVGQILPRWEVAAYLQNPAEITRSARVARWTVMLSVLLLLAAVGIGSYLILRSVNLEMRLAARKTDFVSSVSHELKTPLTSIRMFSELLVHAEKPDPDKTLRYSGIISKESARLTRLINRLLDFSRIDREEVPRQESDFEARDWLTELVTDFESQLKQDSSGGESELEIHLNVPTDSLPVRADRDALAQVVFNLLQNADKYARSGKVADVSLRSVDPDSIEIEVADRGPGVPARLRRRIFEKATASRRHLLPFLPTERPWPLATAEARPSAISRSVCSPSQTSTPRRRRLVRSWPSTISARRSWTTTPSSWPTATSARPARSSRSISTGRQPSWLAASAVRRRASPSMRLAISSLATASRTATQLPCR